MNTFPFAHSDPCRERIFSACLKIRHSILHASARLRTGRSPRLSASGAAQKSPADDRRTVLTGRRTPTADPAKTTALPLWCARTSARHKQQIPLRIGETERHLTQSRRTRSRWWKRSPAAPLCAGSPHWSRKRKSCTLAPYNKPLEFASYSQMPVFRGSDVNKPEG